MTGRTTLIAAILCLAMPVFAQTPGAATPPKPPPPAHQPGVAAPGAHSSTPATTPPPDSSDKIDPAKEAAIRHLMDVTQTAKLGQTMSDYITSQVRTGLSQSLPADTVPKFMDTFSQKFTAAAPAAAVTDAMVAIYAKAFSMEDIQGLIQFYESPLGQRVVKSLPEVDHESQAAGIQIEQTTALAVLRSMTDEYPQLKQILPPENGQPGDPGAGNGPQSPGPSPAPQQP